MDASQDSGSLSRRDFVQISVTGSLLAATGFPFVSQAAEKTSPEVWIIEGNDRRALMQKACRIIRDQGGLGRQVKNLALKVNSAWARKPEVGANTHPALVSEFIKQCQDAGIKEITVPENPCNNPRWAFTRSGIKEAIEDAGAEMIDLRAQKKFYREQEIPKGKNLKKAEVARQFLEADTVVNMPIVKHHGGAKLTIGMKNWMGAVRDRGFWHRNNLHQCIADFTSFLQPEWTIIDATTFMPDSGPQGPSSNLKRPNKLVVSRAPVAADAVTASEICGKNPADIGYLQNADDMGLGIIDIKAIAIHTMDIG